MNVLGEWPYSIVLSSGLISQITILDVNILNSISSYAKKANVNSLILLRELSNFVHLSAICLRNDFQVLALSTLPSVEALALTFNREGMLVV